MEMGGKVPATLTKIIKGKPVASDTLTNEQTGKCPHCEQTYRLGHSDGEWHRVKDWLKLAESAIRMQHGLKHKAATIPLEWRGIRATGYNWTHAGFRAACIFQVQLP
jgi:hypothetical protein